jgi:tetratricopeptide (TPR) repeat protein
MRQAIVLAKMQRVEEARRLLAETPAAGDGQRQQLTLTEAQVLREARRFEESYQLLAAALAQSPDDTALLYDAAMAAERLGRVDEMERLLRRLMQLRPDEPHAYNALGYTFADRNQRLPEAYELIDRALKLAPDDAHIIDSMGWVYFRMGNLARAREFLERAFALRPEAEIGAHLGEVLWTLGERDAARRIWRQVRADEPDNETLSATLARLQVRL